LPLVGILAIAAVLIGGVIGLALSKDGGNGSKRASAGRTTTQSAAAKKKTTTPAPAAAASEPPAAAAAKPAASSKPADLNAQGFRLIQANDYAGAVAPLRAAVQGYRAAGNTDVLDYYFALYNLGVALNRSGNPREAIPFLQERLQNPNQRATVQAELKSAQNQLNGGGGAGKKPKAGKGQRD
jgi:tetratricopeptide (TPR) repeat protein